jgi:hypothetical protein
MSRTSPGPIPGLTDVRELSVSPNSQGACARTGTAIECWGVNTSGILGDPIGGDVLAPTQVLAACP